MKLRRIPEDFQVEEIADFVFKAVAQLLRDRLAA